MNKLELVGVVAERAGLARGEAGRAVDSVFEAITDSLARGEEVRLVGFGSFVVGHRKASTGRNPRTREPMEIKASTVPKFRVGKGLKDAVNVK